MIPDIKKILYATDLSETARHAFGYADNIANRHDAKITILHVVEELSTFARSMVADIVGEKRLADIKTEKQKEVRSELKTRWKNFVMISAAKRPVAPL